VETVCADLIFEPSGDDLRGAGFPSWKSQNRLESKAIAPTAAAPFRIVLPRPLDDYDAPIIAASSERPYGSWQIPLAEQRAGDARHSVVQPSRTWVSSRISALSSV
jgi:hypothetical protein